MHVLRVWCALGNVINALSGAFVKQRRSQHNSVPEHSAHRIDAIVRGQVDTSDELKWGPKSQDENDQPHQDGNEQARLNRCCRMNMPCDSFQRGEKRDGGIQLTSTNEWQSSRRGWVGHAWSRAIVQSLVHTRHVVVPEEAEGAC